MKLLTNVAWRVIAAIVSLPFIADYLIRRALRTPYFHLPDYMNRWWLFNAYSSDTTLPEGERGKLKRFRWLPSIRIHHILREDRADHPHDHPWNARTIILYGHYLECRPGQQSRLRAAGDTAAIRFGEFHHIARVSPGGVFTLFITWRYCGGWGFLVDGVKVPWRQYVAEHPERG